MGRKKKPELDDKEQSARFIETAERIELVENPKEVFEGAFKKIIESRKTYKNHPSQKAVTLPKG
jgi:hypothetical protein